MNGPVARNSLPPRIALQIRANSARGVRSTQSRLAADLGISQTRISIGLQRCIERGLVEACMGVVASAGRPVRYYALTEAGRAYVAEQTQGAGP